MSIGSCKHHQLKVITVYCLRKRNPEQCRDLWMRTLIAFSVLFAVASARIYTECELANELKNYDMPGTLEDWVCLAEAESSLDTTAEGHGNSDGSTDYGIFQINSQYWCGPGNGCNIDCSALLTDDISDDVECAKIVYAQSGYPAWVGWNNKCQGPLPDLSGC